MLMNDRGQRTREHVVSVVPHLLCHTRGRGANTHPWRLTVTHRHDRPAGAPRAVPRGLLCKHFVGCVWCEMWRIAHATRASSAARAPCTP